MKYFISIFLVLLTLIFATGFGYIVYKDNQYVPASSKDISNFAANLRFSSAFSKEKRLLDTNNVINSGSVKLHGWIPSWAMGPGLKTVEEKRGQFSTVSPIYYLMQEDGTIQKNTARFDELKNLLNGTNTKIVPTISSFNATALGINISNETSLNTYNNYILKEVEDNGYAGIDLNYEQTFLKDKEAFLSHIKTLSTELHKKGKIFSVTVLSKWSDLITYGFAPETRKVQDYTEIGKVADQVRIMTYDYTSQGSANPGAIAPISWVQEVLDYATKRIEPSKIVLGIPLYGYFWGGGETSARALDFRQITEILAANPNPDMFYSNKNAEGALKYIGSNGKAYFGYYSTPESIKARMDLAALYKINGVVFWRLGDDPL